MLMVVCPPPPHACYTLCYLHEFVGGSKRVGISLTRVYKLRGCIYTDDVIISHTCYSYYTCMSLWKQWMSCRMISVSSDFSFHNWYYILQPYSHTSRSGC